MSTRPLNSQVVQVVCTYRVFTIALNWVQKKYIFFALNLL
jgi:hypothetical protein